MDVKSKAVFHSSVNGHERTFERLPQSGRSWQRLDVLFTILTRQNAAAGPETKSADRAQGRLSQRIETS